MGSLENLGHLISADILVIGGGLAGAFAAIKAKEAGAKRVVLVEKAKTGKSGCSYFAAGVIHAFMPEEDDFDAWLAEAVDQGCYMNDQEWTEVVLKEVFDHIKEMDKWGVTFEKTPAGKYERRHMRGSAPGRPMKAMMFHGPQMMETVAAAAVAGGVEIVDRVMVTDLLTRDEKVVGAVGFDARRGDFKIFEAKATVLASGGTAYKGLFANHKMDSGDASAMLYRAGAVLRGFDFCSHHASAAAFDILGMNMFVALGGRFVNGAGEPFLSHYDPVLKDRTLARTYSQAMALEVMAGRGPIYMDMTHFSGQDVAKLRVVLPLIMKGLEAAGVVQGDKIVKKMEYVATCQGTIGGGGGARINLKCETSLPGLYAAGDAAHRSPGGTGAMGVGALVFAAVSGARAGLHAAEHAGEAERIAPSQGQVSDLRTAAFAPYRRMEGVEPDQIVLALQETLIDKDVFIIVHEDRLKKALERLNDIYEYEAPHLFAYDAHYLRMAHEAINMIQTGQIWLTSALERKESRGPILRQDYPNTDNVNGLKWVVARQKSGSLVTEVEPIPIEKYRIRPKREVYLAPMWQKAKERGIKWA